MKFLPIIAAIFLCSCGNSADKQNVNDSIFSTTNAQDTTTMLKHDTATPAPGHTALMNGHQHQCFRHWNQHCNKNGQF